MTLDGFDEIAAAWAPILGAGGFQIELHSVFCHSRPHVTFAPVPHPMYRGGTTPRRCELADLLIVIDYVDRREKVEDRRAVLVQAKMLKGAPLKLSGKEWVQHELLAWLPAFTFVDKAYDPRIRDLKGPPIVGFPRCTAEYGGIDLNNSTPEWWNLLAETTKPWCVSRLPLSLFMAKMATGDYYCSRTAIRGGCDDWSFTVDELLRVTASLPITKKSDVARGNYNVVGFIAETSSLTGLGDGGGEDFIEGEVPEWPEGPMSTVHVTLSRME
ncbi:hypothetical protein NVS89_22640 [Ancylobacter sp. MQZ15Z-1]|uniref:Uncharacterized protein n=1 Tax=Ancylobacter mangrovi TaxID=2972472 RepID=A0A9X2PQB4_9HYPH|nr:hypothetical protein [Ancylobacter mangrovi]MCS0497893.1 hypothetical protein [Ancylobacter mangrovi]